MKTCACCQETKSLFDFPSAIKRKDGIYPYCKKCCRTKDRARRQTKEHKNEMKRRNNARKQQKEYDLAHPPLSRKCTLCNQEKLLVDFASDKSKKYGKDSRCKICMRKRDNKRNSRPEVKKHHSQYNKEYKSQPRVKEKIRQQDKARYANNAGYAISTRISAVMNECLRNTPKRKHGRRWEDLVGYSLEDLMKHLELLFLPGMSWGNRELWHIDHIKPRSLFNITSFDCEEFKECWDLNNLQPLWAKDNMSKRNKY